MSARDARRVASGEAGASDVIAETAHGVMNLVSGKLKSSVFFQARDKQACEKWMLAIQSASVAPSRLRRPLDARAAIRRAASSRQYINLLRRFIGPADADEPGLQVPVDWVRSASVEDARAGARARSRKSIVIADATNALEAQLLRTRTAAQAYSAGRKQLARAASRASVTFSQLCKDMVRDELVLCNSLRFAQCQPHAIVEALALQLVRALRCRYSRRMLRLVPGVFALAFEFAMHCLLRSSRTVSGGDAYDAVQLVSRRRARSWGEGGTDARAAAAQQVGAGDSGHAVAVAADSRGH